MSEKAFQRIYTKLSAITKATVTLEAQGVANDELALVAGRLAQVVKIKDNSVTLQVFGGTEDIPTNAEVTCRVTLLSLIFTTCARRPATRASSSLATPCASRVTVALVIALSFV